MEQVEKIDLEKVFLKQSDYIDDKAIGTIDDSERLYLIDRSTCIAYKLPDKYQNTPIIIYHPCGGYDDSGMIMVSLLGEIDLQYHHDYYDVAGVWGWIDLDGNEIISPKYVYAMNFFGNYAIVCKGEWNVDKDNKYWCEKEEWGVIDRNENEIVPLKYDDEITFLNADKVAVKNGHFEDGKWIEGTWRVFDIKLGKEIFELEKDSLRYSEIKFDYLKIYDVDDDTYYLYDFKEKEYLFRGEGLEDIEIIDRGKFIKTKK